MNTIKQTTTALALKLKEHADNEAQIVRAEAAIDAARPSVGALDTLRQHRNDEIGLAFIEKRPADLVGIDQDMASIKKEVAEIQAASEAAASALHLLKIRGGQLVSELEPLREAQDTAINAFAAVKAAEAHTMLATALADVNTAFEHMAAAPMINRTPISPFANSPPAWKHHLDQLVNSKFNVHMRGADAVFASLKAELSALGVTDPGVRRLAQRAKPVPTVAAPDPVVSITFSQPTNAQEFAGQYVPGFVPASHR